MRKTASKLEHYMNLPYTVEIVPYQDGGFFARIKELEGCMTEGETLKETLELLEDAKRAWLETALEDGLEIPLPESMREEKEYSGKILLRLPKSLHKKLAESAQKEEVSLNTYIISLLSEKHAGREILENLVQNLRENIFHSGERDINLYGEYETQLKLIKPAV